MLTMLTLLLSFVNFILILGIIVYYLCTHYVIIDRESWETISELIAEYQQEDIEQPVELPGGNGFFREYIEEEEEDEEE